MAEKGSHHPWLMERRYFSLIIVLAFLIFSTVTFSICLQHHTINTEQTLKEDRSVANLLSVVLEEHVKKLVSVMESYVQRPLLLQAVRDKNVEKAMEHLINLKKSNPDVDILIITDRQGTFWISYPERPESLGMNLAYRDWYRGVSKEWKPNISDVVLRIVREKDLAFQISVPCINENGEVIGILLNTQRTVGLSYLFKPGLLDPDAFITVTDRKGQIVYSSQRDVETEIRPYPFHSGIKKAMAEKNKTFAVDDLDLGGRTRYISFAPVVNIGWTIFVERDKRSIILSEAAYYVQVTIIAFLLFLSMIFFLFNARKQVAAQQIIEQLQAEKKIRAGEEKLRTLSARQEAILAAVPEIIMEVDGNKVYTWANSAGIQFFGDGVIGKEADFYFEGEQYTYDTVKPLFSGVEDVIYVESWQRRKDGEKRLLAWWCRVLKSESGQVSGALSSARDITERKWAEEALLKSEKLYRSLFEHMLNGFAYCRMLFEDGKPHDFIYLAVNDAFESQTGLKDVVGRKVTEVIPGIREADPQLFEIYGRVAMTGRPEHFEIFIETLRMWFWISVYSPAHEHFVAVFDVITKRKQAEEEIRLLNQELEQRVIDRTIQLEASNKELKAFSYSVSHDLRGPLRSIDGFSQALLEDYGDRLDDTGRNYLERVCKATQHMGWLIEDMLKLSRVSQSEFHRETVDLSCMVRAIADNYQQRNPDRAVDVIVQEGIMVQGDPYMIKIAMENLISNAWKFTGKVLNPRVEFGMTVKDGKTACFIRDNGAGFDMTYVGKLFGAFQRLHTVDEFPGTGVGLATVQRVIHRHGGRIWAEGEIGKGATFTFTVTSGQAEVS